MRHVSNSLEEVAACASRGLGLPGLEACHRLDAWTTGLLVLSRNKEANRCEHQVTGKYQVSIGVSSPIDIK